MTGRHVWVASTETRQKAAVRFSGAMNDLGEAYEDFIRAYNSEREPKTAPRVSLVDS